MSSPAKEKSRLFAVHIVQLYRQLCSEKKEFVLSKQLLRSGTSIGANLAEAECAVSRSDFTAKVYIALKECAESMYWLELLHDAQFLTDEQFLPIYKECTDLRRILTATTKTLSK